MKRLLTICLLAALSLGASAQDNEHKRREQMAEKFQADKVAFISQKMDLTVAEAEAFWPVYNEYSKASDQAHKEIMDAVRKIHKSAELSDAEAAAAIDALLAAQKKENDLKEQYTQKFKKVLPVKKVAAFFAAEDDFRQHLFRRVKDREKPAAHGEKRINPRQKESAKHPAAK